MNSIKFDFYFDDQEDPDLDLEILANEFSIECSHSIGRVHDYHIMTHQSEGILTVTCSRDRDSETLEKISNLQQTGFILVDRESQILYDDCYLKEIEFSYPGDLDSVYTTMTILFRDIIGVR